MADRPETNREIPDKISNDDAQWRAAGDRIQTLLDSCAAGGAAAYERAQELVREVAGLYGAALERIVRSSGDPGLPERLATDDLVASLLLVHGLHPHDVHRRVSDALDRVRPYLGSHGGDVDLLEVTGDTVRLAFQGSCKSCPSSAVTLELAVEDAVRAAAPEIGAIEVVTAEPATSGGSPPSTRGGSPPSTIIPAESLMAHVRPSGAPTAWHGVPELAELAPGEVGGFAVAETPAIIVLACRVGDETFAYRDHCPVCDDSMAGARLHDTLLSCPRCLADYDVVRAGAGPDGMHLDPLPLLPRDGVLSVALPAEAIGVPA
jgi:Fe-S cluster biogenesis protein NfuA/nitrite reductase/ring-hydroxylating ferredoxin subunit